MRRPGDKAVLVMWLSGVLLLGVLGVLGDYYILTLPHTLPTLPTPAPPPPVTENISDRINEAGMITEDIKAVSSDGLVTLIIPKGTRALDAEGRRLKSITIDPVGSSPTSLWITSPTSLSIKGYLTFLGVLAYNLQPEGATFDPPIKLVMGYNKTSVLGRESKLTAAYSNTTTLSCEFVYGTLDTEANVMTFRLDRTLRSVFLCIPIPPPEVDCDGFVV